MNRLHVQELISFTQAHAGVVLLDVREPWEVALAPLAVEGARTLAMPMGDVPARRTELDPQQPVVCFCHHGMRSAQVVAFLMHHGHAAVYNLEGGTDAWARQVDPAMPRY